MATERSCIEPIHQRMVLAMLAKVMLAPNPNRSMAIDGFIVIGESEDRQRVRVLNIDALSKDPKIMHAYRSGYSWATAIWNSASVLVFFGSVALSFLWHWWTFILGFFVTSMIVKASRQSTADFALKILGENKIAYNDFVSLGLIWDASATSVVPQG